MPTSENSDSEIQKLIRTKLPGAVASEFVRYGKRGGVQLYLHKPTGRKVTANDALPGRRISPRIVGDAIGAFYDGLSYRDIQRRIDSVHGFKPSTATLYEWVRDYSARARRFLDNFKAETGSTWAADEMVVKVDGEDLWLWSVMDTTTRYLLATHISKTRTIKDAQTLFCQAKRNAKRVPTVILTDGLKAYIEGIEGVFGGDTRHEVSLGIRSPLNNNMVERLNGTVRERTKVMRGMETKNTAELLLDGFRVHYNHMRPHEGIDGRTPAQAAGMPFSFQDWVEVAHLREGDGVAQGNRSILIEPTQALDKPKREHAPFRESRPPTQRELDRAPFGKRRGRF